MKKLLAGLCLVSLVTACDTPEQTALTGAALGAAAGAATAGKDETKGALIGAAAGLAAGTAVAAAQEGKQCIYRYPDGTSYTAACPEGY